MIQSINAILLLLFLQVSTNPSIVPLSPTEELTEGRQHRVAITFILGEDKNKTNKYYEMAEAYYRQNNGTKNDLLITSCRSLIEIQNYLQTHPTDNGLAYGTVRLVVHSNEWRGMGIPVVEEGERIDIDVLSKSLATQQILPIDITAMDTQSELIINACGLGKNTALLQLLQTVFGGCKISATPYFVLYENSNGSPNKYMADYYYGFFRTGYRPADSELIQQLKQRYPNDKINWKNALSKKQPTYIGDSYHYYFNVPVEWVVTFPSEKDRPKFRNEQEKISWLRAQADLMKVIDKTNIPLDKFRWQFKYRNYTFEDGVTAPAIMIKGKTSILCVLKARG